ncbi:MAG TPA: dTDP-4-dehydrorhamnose 3,5-epimerase [Sphingomicrobium sp.]|nr:dTDP-4-dehydrorhamnose 3,5-epimerase [Sphingomicrobium sp.]
MPDVRPLEIEGLLEFRPRKFGDDRGFFSEVWRDDWQSELGLNTRFVQDNHSYSKSRGVLRGMHFQSSPAAQDKLIRVARGSIFDVALDIRTDSATYGQWEGIVLSAKEWNQLFIPRGFAHGFVTLEDDTEVLYKVSHAYSPEHDRAIRFDDPAVGIDWPVDSASMIVSQKDRTAPLLAEIEPEL